MPVQVRLQQLKEEVAHVTGLVQSMQGSQIDHKLFA
jgi:hypothetical protein